MNLHAIARPAVGTVNPFITATYRKSIGNTSLPNAKRVPEYAPDVPVQIQPQATNGKELQQIQFLNLEGVFRGVHMDGNTQGVVRANQKGGDLLLFPQTPGAPVQTWLVISVTETWPDWCRVLVCLQDR